MLEKYFKDFRILWRMRNNSVVGAVIDEFADYVSALNLSLSSSRGYIRAAAHFGRYATWEGIDKLSKLTVEFACRFVNEHLPNCTCERLNGGAFKSTISGIWHFMDFLGMKGVVKNSPNIITVKYAPRQSYGGWLPKQNSSLEKQQIILSTLPNITGSLVTRYDNYLENFVGLTSKTRDIHRLKTLHFLKWMFKTHGNNFDISDLSAKDILDFQVTIDEKGLFSADYKRTVTACLRSFLRFLLWERIIDVDLTPAVYKVIKWKKAGIPKYIPYGQALLLLHAPDRTVLTGKRDYLMLFLMLKLGLRACEVIGMKNSDVDLTKGELTISKTKTSKQRKLPLDKDAADAFSDYLTNRPVVHPDSQIYVFLRVVPPFCRITSSSALGTMVKLYISKTGIATPTFGTHQLRHSLATHLVNNGVTFKDTADLLGHSSLDTTSIYAKVQIEKLREIALPFPAIGGLYSE